MTWFNKTAKSAAPESGAAGTVAVMDKAEAANDDGLPLAKPMVIQVMRFEPGQPVFGFVTREHLAVFQIPLQAFEDLYRAWLRLLEVHDETGTVSAVWTDGELLHVALKPIHVDLELITCLRWSLMMNAIGLNAVIEKDVRDAG